MDGQVVNFICSPKAIDLDNEAGFYLSINFYARSRACNQIVRSVNKSPRRLKTPFKIAIIRFSHLSRES